MHPRETKPLIIETDFGPETAGAGTPAPTQDLPPAASLVSLPAVNFAPVPEPPPAEQTAPCPVPPGTCPESEESRLREANRRLAVLEAVEALKAQDLSERQACKRAGVDQATYMRWRRRYAERGFAGLIPETQKRGRKSAAALCGLTGELAAQVQAIALDTGSVTSAARLFAHSDRCPEPLAEAILDPTRHSKHALPPSLRSAFKVNANLQKAHRGRRALDLGGIWIPRKVDILPGDIFTSDDTTPIWAWWVPWVQSEEYPHGVKLLQGQFLPVMDVASQAVITFVLIAREKASYRAADIWHLFGHTFDSVGLPRLGWQLERGSWEANVIRGQAVEYREGEASYTRRVGGLRQLPTNITEWHREKFGPEFSFPPTLQTFTSYLPKSKSIEALFNRSQALEGTLWGCLGRDQMRRPNEKAKKLYEACKRPGGPDPREHFLSHLEICNRLRDMLAYLNSEPMEGEVFRGIPQHLWAGELAQRPLCRMPEEYRWLYRRDWKVLKITQGWARVRLTDELSGQRYSLFYVNPEVFAAIEGEEVVVYYDRENFEQPAQILSARTGEYLCEASYFERRGSFLDGDRTGYEVKKRWANAVLSTYGTISAQSPSRTLPAEIVARREAGRISREANEGSEGREAKPAPVTTSKPFAPFVPSRETRRPLTPEQQRALAEPEDFTALGEPEKRTASPESARSYAASMEELEQL